MKAKVSEIAADVYRISTFHPEYGIQFNQFLIKDDEPFIMHTGFKKMFPITLDPERMGSFQRLGPPQRFLSYVSLLIDAH